MFRDRLLLVCLSCVLLTYATEITYKGSCPPVKPLEDAALSDLNGFFYAIAAYSFPGDGRSCTRFRFNPRTEHVTDYMFRYKFMGAVMGGILGNYYIETTKTNGAYIQRLPHTHIYFGQMYILDIRDNVTVIYTCRHDILNINKRDVYVLSLNTTYPPETEEFVKETLDYNGLDYGYIRPQEQSEEQCNGMIIP